MRISLVVAALMLSFGEALVPSFHSLRTIVNPTVSKSPFPISTTYPSELRMTDAGAAVEPAPDEEKKALEQNSSTLTVERPMLLQLCFLFGLSSSLFGL